MSISDLEKRMKKIRDSLNVAISQKKRKMHKLVSFLEEQKYFLRKIAKLFQIRRNRTKN